MCTAVLGHFMYQQGPMLLQQQSLVSTVRTNWTLPSSCVLTVWLQLPAPDFMQAVFAGSMCSLAYSAAAAICCIDSRGVGDIMWHWPQLSACLSLRSGPALWQVRRAVIIRVLTD